jgi:phage protein D
MSNTTQNRLGTSFTVSYPDFPSFTITPKGFTLIQETGKQDVLEITYLRDSIVFYKGLKTGATVKLEWKTSNNIVGEFFGYVVDYTPITQQTLRRPVTIRAIGASLPLKEGGNKIWKNKTAPDIIIEIAKKFKLKPVVTPHPMIFSQQSMLNHTYWEKIQELAGRIGYVAQVNGTELHFHPIDKMIDKFITTIPVLSFFDPVGNIWNELNSQTLDMFKPKVGDYIDKSSYSKKDKVVSGVDPVTGKFYSSSKSPTTVGKNLRTSNLDPLFLEILPGAMTGNAQVANTIAQAHAQLSRFSITADASSQGDPRISPYRTVEINGTGSTTDGNWIIKKTRHQCFYDGRYEVEFTCMTDGTGRNKSSAFRPETASVIPTRNIQQELSTGTTSRPPVTKLRAPQMLVNKSNVGFKVTPSRWVGK